MTKSQTRSALKIGELAQRLGLNVRTLRHYESIGLLPAPPRTEGGYRLYTEEDERRLRLVLQAKHMGLSLEEIGRILELRRHGSACSYVRQTVSRHVEEIDKQLADLRSLRAVLLDIMARGAEDEKTSDEPVCALIEGEALISSTNGDEPHTTTEQAQTVEVFTAGCPLCDPVVELVRRVAGSSCSVTVYNVSDDPQAARRAKEAGIDRVPMVLIDGQPLECCQSGSPTEEALREAGVGST